MTRNSGRVQIAPIVWAFVAMTMIAIALVLVAGPRADAQADCVPEFTQAFRDDFSGDTVADANWNQYFSPGHDGNGLRRPSALGVADGLLTVTAQMIDGELVSGGMSTRADYTYGRFEARVRTGAPDPLQATSGVLIAWPTDQDWDGTRGDYTELDFYETTHGRSTRSPFYAFVHYNTRNNHAQPPTVYNADATDWHDMRMDWTPGAIRFFMDGTLVNTITQGAAIPDRPHKMTVQLDAFKQAMEGVVTMDVDWVRISRYNPDFDPNCGSDGLPVNGDFESPTLAPWEIYSASDADAANRYTGNADTGIASLSHYKSTAYEVDTYQKVPGLANGAYELQARVKSGGGQDIARMYVLDHGGARLSYDIPPSSAWVDAKIPFTVSTGQSTVGFWSKASAGEWLLVDNVRIVPVEGESGATIRVRARGTTGVEQIAVLVDGAQIATRQLGTSMQTLSFGSNVADPAKVQVRFMNDGRTNDVDRNVYLDWVEVDDQRLQAEDPANYSTGAWNRETGCADGYNKRSQWLACNGYIEFDFGSPSGGDGVVVNVRARGTSGAEQIALWVNGSQVETATLGTSMQTVSFATSVGDATAVRVQFVNNGTTNGIDRNVRVDWIEVDGVRFQTESPSTFSTGTWNSATRCGDGYKSSEWLHCNGFLEYQL